MQIRDLGCIMSSKKASETQNYDDEYWELTLEYTDIDSERFRGTLEIIRDFYNQHHAEITSSGFTVDLNKKLQEQVNTAFPKKTWALHVKQLTNS